jgi:hypothetical protein
MLITIKNIAAVRELSLDLGPGPNILAGSNEAGKTTACEVISALLVRDAKLDRTKAEIEQLIRQGSRSGSAVLGDQEGKVSCRWPDPELEVEGDPPAASPVVSGRVHPVRLPPKERTAIFVESLKALPTKTEWLAGAANAGLTDEVAMKLWDKVADLGWDGAAEAFAKKAREGKGAWKQVTNAAGYPARGAETWQVAGYDDDLLQVTVESCNVTVAELQGRRDQIVQGVGKVEAERARLQRLADQVGQLRDAVENAEAALEQANGNLAQAQKAFKGMKRGQLEVRCPHCNLPIQMQQDPPFLTKPDPKAQGSTTDPKVYDDAQRAVARAENVVNTAERSFSDAARRSSEAEAAAADLAKLPPPQAVDTSAIDAELERAKTYREAVRVTHEAMRIHREIVGYAKAAELAGPMGLRKAKLSTLIEAMNGSLADLCEAAGWKKLEIDLDLNVSLGGFAWANLSQGARWRVDAALAMYFAERDGSHVMVLDGADVLDARGRNGLLKLAGEFEIPVLIGMTLTRSDAQKLAGAGYPVTFIHDGVGETLGAPAMAAE